MATKDFLKKYAESDLDERLEIIIDNYATFMGIVESYTEGIIYMIEEEQDCARRRENGELGVRVQTSVSYSDTTAKKAIRNVSIRDAVLNCDFSSGVLEDTDHEEIFIEKASVLRRMRKEYRLLNSQIQSLQVQDGMLLKAFLSKEMNLCEVAAKCQIEYDSAQQKLRRLKIQVKERALLFAIGGILEEVE